MGKEKVTVAVTPNGLADAVVNDLFMLPEEREMEFTTFLDELGHPPLDQVFYLQKQNNNLIEEFSPLTCDIDTHITWATEAFGNEPEAVNIWIGDNRSVSSMHKDHYENLYYVIVGTKKFDLYPPVASCWMPYKKYKKYQWYYEDKQWKMKDLNEEIKWISSDKKPETPKKLLLYCKTKSFCVELEPGHVCLYQLCGIMKFVNQNFALQ
ncbi:Bifunctional peptidase and (3S)-lysyl like protein [Argiope bruennichi]|uniref:Bifunctional peptidase and (3S)-lysyl like protein n=1 Tax=Argiope bruennichi TaxID=94029 RepID=A0A8T0FIT2_ARGBR|nr:Bifunctional peptidase and (3S)-lysyl like protein [Argiope bruennichi]